MLLALIIGICFCLLLMTFSYKYYARLRFFLATERWLGGMELNINFLQKDVLSILNAQKETRSITFESMLKSYKTLLNDNDKKKFYESINNLNYVNDEDKERLYDYFSMLGHSDCDTQTQSTRALVEYVKSRIILCRQEINQKALVIQKLSIILGLVVFILLV